MATRRNRIVVKPNLKPAVPKSAAAAAQKTKPKVTAPQEPAESSIVPGNKAAPPEKSASITPTGEVDKKKGGDKGIADLQNSGDVEGNAESGAVKQKLNAHLLKKSSTSTLSEELENVIEGNDKPANEQASVISIEDNVVAKGGDSVDSNDKEKETTVVDIDNAKETTLEPVADKTVPSAVPDDAHPSTDTPTTADKNDSLIGEDDVENADILATSDKSKDIPASDSTDVTVVEGTPQPKPQRKKREKKERKDPLQPSDKSPDRHKMKMSDLIVWNPKQNYFPKKKKSTNTSSSIKKEEQRPSTPESVVSLDDESSNQSSSLPAPRVMIGPDGNIVLDTQSLIIETPKDDTEAKAVVEEDDDDRYLNSNSYRKTSKTKMWTENENERFFIGLSMCGTDFSLMSNLLPKRSRRELKNKFRREEKRNRILIDKALSSRQPYDKTPFDRMAEEETARLKAELEIKKEAKRKCKAEATADRQKKIKKERDRMKRKAQQSEDEEDDWGDELEFDDEENEVDPEDEIGVRASARAKKRRTAGEVSTVAPQIITNPAVQGLNQDVIEETVVYDDQHSTAYPNQQLQGRASAVSPMGPQTTTQLLPPPPPQQSVVNQRFPAPTALAASGITVRQTGAVNTAGPASNLANSNITAGLRSIPGTAPIQIEMEGVMAPMQGVLIPSHLVPQLAPQLGIPQSSTPMQVLLVQEEGGSGGSMVHVYVLPEKDSTPFPQTGQGRVSTDGSGQGLTLTSPVPSPHPPPRRPSTSSTPTSAMPFSPTNSQSFPFRSPPHAPSTPGPSADSETSMSTIRNVYGTAMNSLSPAATTGKESMGNPSPAISTVNHDPLACNTNPIPIHQTANNIDSENNNNNNSNNNTYPQQLHHHQQQQQQQQYHQPSS